MDLRFDLAAWTPRLLQGLVLTLEITVLCIAIGIVLGLLIAMGRIYGRHVVYGICSVYVNFFRGTPILVQLFLVYYGLPSIGVRFDGFTAGVLAFGLNTAAYQAEYFRGAIQSLPSGQMWAARSVGMTPWQSLRHIILPQALRLVIPPWSNELILMLKYSSIIFLATVQDLMGEAKIIAGDTFRYFEVFIVVALMYLAIVLLITWGLRWFENRIRVPGLGGGGAGS